MENRNAPQNDRERAMQGGMAEIAHLLQMACGRAADLRGELAIAAQRIQDIETENQRLRAEISRLNAPKVKE